MAKYQHYSFVELTRVLSVWVAIYFSSIHAQSWNDNPYGVFNPASRSHLEVNPPHGTCGDGGSDRFYHRIQNSIMNCSLDCDASRRFPDKFDTLTVTEFLDLNDMESFWASDCVYEELEMPQRKRAVEGQPCALQRVISDNSYYRETYTFQIKPENSNLKDGVIFDVFIDGNTKGPTLRINGNDLKLYTHTSYKEYDSVIPSDTWTDIAIQVDDDQTSTSNLFINGEYIVPTDTVFIEQKRRRRRDSGARARERRKRSASVNSRSRQWVSFGMVSDVAFSLPQLYQFLMIPECRAIHYSGLVFTGLSEQSQAQLSASVFDRESETSIYTCSASNERLLTLFACAHIVPPASEHVSEQDFSTLQICRHFCEEIYNDCGSTLRAIPEFMNLNCSNLPDSRDGSCVDSSYTPYSGIYEGKIRNYKYYNEILTNREIKYLSTETFPEANPHSECLCPPHAPAVIPQNNDYCFSNDRLDFDTDIADPEYALVTFPSRYHGSDLHLPQHAVDNQYNTSWVSKPGLSEVSFSILFLEDLQVMGVTINLGSDFPVMEEMPPSDADTVYALEIALLNGDLWRTVYYVDIRCSPSGSGNMDTYHASEVVCSAPQFPDVTVDLLQGREAYYNDTYMDVELVSFLNSKGLRIKFNALPMHPEDIQLTDEMSQIVNEVQVHARRYEGRTLCNCYAGGTDNSGECNPVTGQCPCRSDIGNPAKAGLKCEPYVSIVVPTFGPVAGGTLIVLAGGYFGNFATPSAARNHIHIALGDTGLSCQELLANQTAIGCYTPALNVSADVSLARYIDQPLQLRIQLSTANGSFSIVDEDLTFTYKPNPEISQIEPLTSFLRGGIIQTVTGQDFFSVFRPYMEVTVLYNGLETAREREPCEVRSNTVMWCPTPEIQPDTDGIPRGRRRRDLSQTELLPGQPDDLRLSVHVDEIDISPELSRRVRRQTLSSQINTDYLQFYVGFILDGVPTYVNASEVLGTDSATLTVFNDPEIERWDPSTQIFKPYDGDKYITIDGNRLNFGASKSDYLVQIGSDAECDIEDLHTNNLICSPPSDAPKHDRFSKGDAHRITMEVGNLKFTVGYLQYYETLWDDPTVRAAVISVAVIVGVILLVTLIVCLVLKRLYGDPIAHIRGRLRYKAAAADTNSYEENQTLLMDRLDPELKAKILDCLIVPHNRMKIGHEVGKGNFGKVYSGLLAFPGETQPTDCAIKTLKDDSNNVKELREFLEEATIMKDFKHDNVLTLYGVVIVQNKPHVLLPFMAYGDLRGFVGNPRNNFSVRELLVYGLQIAKGMAYLSSRKFVHRDLAARNCMVDETKTVKIADFGLARDIYEKDYYAVEDRRRPMPIKWMAPECLDTFKFDSRSDVWSYGVTMWEVLMRGRKPYAGVDNLDMKRFLQRGSRLDKPPFCPDVVFDLMLACWRYNPSNRPLFQQIAEGLQQILDEAAQAENQAAEEERPSSGHDYLEMVRMSQPGYVPLEVDVPADEDSTSGANNNGIEPKLRSERYTREPGARPKDYTDSYLKPFTELPVAQQVKDDVEGYSGVRRPSQDRTRYQVLGQNEGQVRESDMPKEQAPASPSSPEGYLAPAHVQGGGVGTRHAVSTSPDGGDGYLPPAQVSVNINNTTAEYSNL